MKYDYDLFVIGAGSGGVRAARIASQAGARVAVAEEYRIGGTCVIRGCVPKKFLVYGAEFSQMVADAPGYGWTVGPASFDWPTLRDNVQKEVTRLSGIYTSNLAKAGVTAFEERAELVDAHTVKLKKSGGEVSAERILIATGGQPLSTRRVARPRARHHLERSFPAAEVSRACAGRGRRIRRARIREHFPRARREDPHPASRRQAAARLRRRPARAHAYRSGARRYAAHVEGHADEARESGRRHSRHTLDRRDRGNGRGALRHRARSAHRGIGSRARRRETG